jgi:hypothetical protein
MRLKREKERIQRNLAEEPVVSYHAVQSHDISEQKVAHNCLFCGYPETFTVVQSNKSAEEHVVIKQYSHMTYQNKK